MNFMKQTILDTFHKMIKETSFNNITVSSLSKIGGINRKTFYYYYDDIYDLAKDYFQNVVDSVTDRYPSTGAQWIDGMKALLYYFVEHKNIAMNMYKAIDYKLFEDVLFNSLIDYSHAYIENKSVGTGLNNEDIEYISKFITFGITGSILQWVDSEMKEDPALLIDRFTKLFGQTLNFIAANAQSLIGK